MIMKIHSSTDYVRNPKSKINNQVMNLVIGYVLTIMRLINLYHINNWRSTNLIMLQKFNNLHCMKEQCHDNEKDSNSINSKI